ncbi:porphobilinogen synthase [Candidatus Epulonipiscium viviparus]|uniref:porphobilinogen synthase n=1 Tax=Candidatus Epulonipiscium viviparus TaxID=420336 RepID=UPI0027380832|nr:porphobilinogen synthase [Candidatus Epulopiscium viviparus]
MIFRPRRLRQNSHIRALVRETHLHITDLVFPIFVTEGSNIKTEISSLPGVYHFSIDTLLIEVAEVIELGIHAVMLFGIPDTKDACGSSAFDPNGIVQRATRALKEAFPDLYIITDVCLCQYTDHGHCGILENTTITNDATLEVLAQVALSHATAGADMVAPSDMMDGRVATIRRILDLNGFSHIPIMAYSAKYASNFYGPFRAAAHSTPSFGDRKSYQMDYANAAEALREVQLDIAEGADIVMVKPALAYLDIIAKVCAEVTVPVAAYNVSGEYAILKLAISHGLLDELAIYETLLSIKRAGATLIISYFAKEVAYNIREGKYDSH